MASLEAQVASQNRCYVNSEVRNPGNSGPPGSGCSYMAALRLLLVMVLGTGSATADPPAKPNPFGPSKTIEVKPWEPPARPTTKTPGMNGNMASGIVIPTDPGGDAQRWPYGMWIPTPDVGDKNVLVPGTNGLSDGSSSALSARLSRGLDDGVGSFLQWLLPPPKLVRTN